jgi:hypothetical protein
MLAAWLLPAFLALAPATADLPTVSLSRVQVDAMAPQAVTSLVFGRRATNIRPMWRARRRGRRPDTPLRLLIFRSTGRSAGVAGLCTADEIHARFGFSGPISGAATRVRLQQMGQGYFYYFRSNRVPTAVDVLTETGRVAEDRACRAFDTRYVRPIFAVDEIGMVSAFATVSRIVATARSGVAEADLDCSGMEPVGDDTRGTGRCMTLIGQIDLNRADWAGVCPDREIGRCTLIELSGGATPTNRIQLRIEMEGGNSPVERFSISRITGRPPSITGD